VNEYVTGEAGSPDSSARLLSGSRISSGVACGVTGKREGGRVTSTLGRIGGSRLASPARRLMEPILDAAAGARDHLGEISDVFRANVGWCTTRVDGSPYNQLRRADGTKIAARLIVAVLLGIVTGLRPWGRAWRATQRRAAA